LVRLSVNLSCTAFSFVPLLKFWSMQPAARYGALLVKNVQKPLSKRLIGGQQVAWASTAVRTSEPWACHLKDKKDQTSRQSHTQWARLHSSISGRTFSISARRRDGVNKDEKEQPQTIHLQPPPPTPDVEEKPILSEQSAPTEPQPLQDQDATPPPTEPPITPPAACLT
jgi:hypothetical protein